jgi:membrane protein required for colicin V production
MSYLDVFLSLIIAWGAYNGFSKGLVNELASVLGVISGIFLAKNFYPHLDIKLKAIFESEAGFISILSAMIIFLFSILIFKVIAKLLTKFLKLIALGLLNRIIGAFFGIIKSVLLLCIVIYIFSKINNITSVINDATLNQSFLYSNIEEINEIIIENNYNENGSEE